MPRANPPLHAVVLAGGSGERFWPASRKARPKQFLRVVGGDTLLEGTLKRARACAREDRVWIVCGREHAAAIRKESGLPASRVLVEPRRRNTAMAAAWAAHRVMAVDEDAVMAVLPADHLVPDVRAFVRDIKRSALVQLAKMQDEKFLEKFEITGTGRSSPWRLTVEFTRG